MHRHYLFQRPTAYNVLGFYEAGVYIFKKRERSKTEFSHRAMVLFSGLDFASPYCMAISLLTVFKKRNGIDADVLGG